VALPSSLSLCCLSYRRIPGFFFDRRRPTRACRSFLSCSERPKVRAGVERGLFFLSSLFFLNSSCFVSVEDMLEILHGRLLLFPQSNFSAMAVILFCWCFSNGLEGSLFTLHHVGAGSYPRRTLVCYTSDECFLLLFFLIYFISFPDCSRRFLARLRTFTPRLSFLVFLFRTLRAG